MSRTGIPRSTIYFNTCILVKEGKIARFKGLPGIFVKAEEEDGDG